jgi:transposase
LTQVYPAEQTLSQTFATWSKNDRNDAEAISEAASRPTMRTVPVKSAEEQAATIIVKHRELLVNQRTQAINALRGHAAEFGIIAAQGCANVAVLLVVLSSEDAIPAVAKAMFEGNPPIFRGSQK